MTSPYFSNINVAQADYSPLARAGEAIGNMYAQTGQNIGSALSTAIGAVGGKYFEDKKLERTLETHLQTAQGKKELEHKFGYTPEQVNDLLEKGTLSKEIKSWYKEIGIDNIRSQVQDEMKMSMQREQHQATMTKLGQEQEQNNLLLNEIKQKNKLSEAKNNYLAYLHNTDDEGNKYLDSLDPAKDFLKSGEDFDPISLQAVQSVNQTMGLGKYSPAMLTSIVNSFKKKDEGGTGEILNAVNFKSRADFEENWNQFTTENSNLPREQLTIARERAEKLIVPTGAVREIIDKGISSSGFGSFVETMKSQIGDMGNFKQMLDESLQGVEFDKNGNITAYDVKNPVAASIALIKLARVAQGAGQLSDRDVENVKGSRRYSDQFKRFFDKSFGSAHVVTKEMWDNGYKNAINPDTGEKFEVGDDAIFGGGQLNAADLLMFRDIAEKLDLRSRQLTDEVIPQVYEEVRANFGGLTTNEIHEFSDLDMYKPTGFKTAEQKMAGVTSANVASAINGLKAGKSRAAIEKMVRNRGGFDPSTGDETNLKMTMDEAERQYKDLQHKGEMASVPAKPLNIPKERAYKLDNLEDGGSMVSAGSGFVSGMAGTKATYNKMGTSRAAQESFNKKFPRTASKITQMRAAVETGSLSDVKNVAKNYNIDTNKYRGNDKALRARVKSKLNQEVKQKVTKWAAKQGFKSTLKKSIVSLVGGAATGGVGFVSGSVLYDVISLAESEVQATKETYDEMLVNAKTEEERSLVKKMKDQYLGNLQKSKPRFEGGQFKGIGSSYFGR
jgi:hypothetical protein